MDADFLSTDDEKAIVAAIASAEKQTTGEIHVHISEVTVSKDGVMSDAIRLFKKLNLDKTAQRNGVLIFIAVKDRNFAIVGDQAVHAILGDTGWQSVASMLKGYFQSGHYRQGLVEAIEKIGAVLKQHFPPITSKNVNELSDEISRSRE